MASPGPSNAEETISIAPTEESSTTSKTGISLAQILSAEGVDLSMPDVKDDEEEGEGSGGESRVPEGNCLECEGTHCLRWARLDRALNFLVDGR